MVGHGRSSAGSYLADPTSPIPFHCASIVETSTVRVNSSCLHARANFSGCEYVTIKLRLSLLVSLPCIKLYFFIVAQIAQLALPMWKHWLGNLGNLGSTKKIRFVSYCYSPKSMPATLCLWDSLNYLRMLSALNEKKNIFPKSTHIKS